MVETTGMESNQFPIDHPVHKGDAMISTGIEPGLGLTGKDVSLIHGMVFPDRPVHAYPADIEEFKSKVDNTSNIAAIGELFSSREELRAKLQKEHIELWKANLVIGAVFGYSHEKEQA